MTLHTSLGELEQLVLLAVARLEGSGYGVSIRREIRARVGRQVTLGAVYATLGQGVRQVEAG
jgi:PadR family transcriptional regulator